MYITYQLLFLGSAVVINFFLTEGYQRHVTRFQFQV